MLETTSKEGQQQCIKITTCSGRLISLAQAVRKLQSFLWQMLVSHAERGWEALPGRSQEVTVFPRNLSITSNTWEFFWLSNNYL